MMFEVHPHMLPPHGASSGVKPSPGGQTFIVLQSDQGRSVAVNVGRVTSVTEAGEGKTTLDFGTHTYVWASTGFDEVVALLRAAGASVVTSAKTRVPTLGPTTVCEENRAPTHGYAMGHPDPIPFGKDAP